MESEELMKMNLKKLHEKKNLETSWKNILFCSFYRVNDNEEIALENAQIMHSILCQKRSSNYNKSKNTSKNLGLNLQND